MFGLPVSQLTGSCIRGRLLVLVYSCLHGRVCVLGYRPKGLVGLPCTQDIVFVVVLLLATESMTLSLAMVFVLCCANDLQSAMEQTRCGSS